MKKASKKLLAVLLSVVMIMSTFAVMMVSAAPSESGLKTAKEIAAEGIVLLKNEEDGLPLAKGAKISVFGSTQLDEANYLGGGGSGSISAQNPAYLLPSLREQGFKLNEELVNVYQTWWDNGGKREDYRPSDEDDVEGEYTSSAVAHAEMVVTDDMIAQAKAFSDTAVIVIGRSGSEGLDLGTSDIGLYPAEIAMIDKVATNFDRVIVLYNICTTLEMGILEQYDSIKAAAIIWSPGEIGMQSVADMLDGTVNPSGKLADTIAYSIFDHPSTVNFGDIVKPQTEEEYNTITPGYYGTGDKYYVEYEEDIYVGYRYFETEAFNAKDKVQFEFGYGLSYTTFDMETVDFEANADKITVRVNVTNTGDVAGKEVVEVYHDSPEIELEKADKELLAYAKTDLLEPGESQLVTISVDTDEMASYSEEREAYILEPGTYNIFVGNSVRNVDIAGVYSLASIKVNKYDSTTGAEIKNLFPDAQNGITLLSKNDIENTYPTAPERGERHVPGSGWSATGANAATSSNVGGRFTERGVMPSLRNNTIMMTDGQEPADIQLYDVWVDNSLMDAFLDQFTDEELIMMQANGGFKTVGIERLGIPATDSQDGPACVKAISRSGKTNGTAFPIGTMVATTWSQELAYKMGVMCGIEAADLGVESWYAPGADAHRNPMGGRNFEYFSEDPVLGGTIMASMVIGALEQGLTPTIKHYAINDQEANRCGVETYVSERAMREIYLKQFEYSIKIGGMGIMASFSRIGTTWCGASRALMTDLTRTEWGFNGFILSDAWIGGYMSVIDATYAGCDTMLGFGTNGYKTLPDFSAEYEENPVEIRAALEDCAKHIVNYVMTTRAFSDLIGTEDNLDYVANTDALTFDVHKSVAKVTSAPESAYVNDVFDITVDLNREYTSLKLVNEKGNTIGIKGLSIVRNDDVNTWTVSTAIGTAGEGRNITILAKTANGQYEDLGLSVTLDILAYTETTGPKAEVISASFNKAVVMKNMPVRATVVTNSLAEKVSIMNENGGNMGKTLVSKVKLGSKITWEYDMKIGTAGSRVFTFAAAKGDNILTDLVSLATITVK